MAKESPVTEATNNTMRNVLIAISVVMFLVLIILVALLVRFWIRSRQKRKVIPVKEANGHANGDVEVNDIS